MLKCLYTKFKKGDIMFIAIKDETTGYSQPLLDHLNKVANLSSSFAKDFDLSDQAFVLGYLHDLGKYSKEFQRQLASNSSITLDYSIAGATELFHRFYSDKDLLPPAKILGMIITGHFNGLLNLGTNQDLDNGTHESKFKKNNKDYYNGYSEIDESIMKVYKEDLDKKITKSLGNKKDENIAGFAWQMIIRMLYSCTVDGDVTDTEMFFKKNDKQNFKSFDFLNDHIDKFIKEKFNLKKIPGAFKKIVEASFQKPNLFTLIAPPNESRSIASIQFGIKHANKNKLNRIIYVLPNDSVIDGVTKLFKDIVGKENVLEHFCDFVNDENSEISEKYDFAIEDWNVPIIVTNSKEFFQTCFSNSFVKLRKLHNISNSLVIFDEIQMLPLGFLNPCFALISELIVNYNSSVLFSSSVSLDFDENLYEEVKKNKIDLVKDIEVIYHEFKRFKFTYLNFLSDDEIIGKLKLKNSVLCVVDTRVHAEKLYEKIKGQGVFYLNSLLTPFDRKKKMTLIEDSLNFNKRCIVISTETAEASLRLDFDFVYRSLSGVDSLFKSAGKCKKEFFVFKPISDDLIRGKNEISVKYGEDILKKYGNKTFSIEAINEYYRLVYNFYYKENKFDEKNIREDFIVKRNQLKFNFKTCSDDFKLEGSNAYNIVIQDEAINEIIAGIKRGHITKENLRKVQQYCVNVYEYEILTLNDVNALQFYDRFILLKDLNLYDDDLGLKCEADVAVNYN